MSPELFIFKPLMCLLLLLYEMLHHSFERVFLEYDQMFIHFGFKATPGEFKHLN